MKTKLTTLILLLALLFLPSASVQAQGPNNNDVFLIGQNYTLKSNETLNGSLAVIGGNAVIEKDAVVKGDIILIGGNLTIDGDSSGNVAIIGGNLNISGEISGDVAVIGGQAKLAETAKVSGDVAAVGGQVDKAPGAEVKGNIVNNVPFAGVPNVPAVPSVPNVPNVPNVPTPPTAPNFNVNFNPLWEVMNVVWRAIAIAAISMLLALFLQPQLERVGDTIVGKPLMAGSFGLVAVTVAPLAIIIMVITLILIPVAIVVAVLFPLAWLFGIVALGQEIGERFTQAINQMWAPVIATGFGTFLLLLVGGFVSLIPCVGWLIPFLVALIAIGGVAMTWFGTRSAPGTLPPQPVVEVPSAS
jgi:hypothetical protein